MVLCEHMCKGKKLRKGKLKNHNGPSLTFSFNSIFNKYIYVIIHERAN